MYKRMSRYRMTTRTPQICICIQIVYANYTFQHKQVSVINVHSTLTHMKQILHISVYKLSLYIPMEYGSIDVSPTDFDNAINVTENIFLRTIQH